jgi:hypothetical protein
VILSTFAIIAGFISLVLGLVVSTSQTDSRSSKWSFVAFALSMSTWSTGVGVFGLTDNQDVATLSVYIYYVAALLISYSLLMFCTSYTVGSVTLRTAFLILIPSIIMAVIIVQPGMFISEISLSNRSVELVSVTYAMFAFIFVSYTVLAMVLMFRRAIRSKRFRKFRVL